MLPILRPARFLAERVAGLRRNPQQLATVGEGRYNPELAAMRERGAGLVHEGGLLGYVPGSRSQSWAAWRSAAKGTNQTDPATLSPPPLPVSPKPSGKRPA